MPSSRKRPPTRAGEAGTTFNQPQEPLNYEDEHPKFCFRYVQNEFDPQSLPSTKQVDLLLQLQKLSQLPWKQIKQTGRHALGTELIPVKQIRAPLPSAFEDEARFMMFRYSGKLPMGGIRVRDVFHVFWIEKEFGDLYDHG